MEKSRAHLLIEGRVQGVSFRAFTLSVAARFGLDGWVRNLRDGRVEAVFEGDRHAIELAAAECRKGPYGAHVTNLELIWEDYSGNLRGFEIRY